MGLVPQTRQRATAAQNYTAVIPTPHHHPKASLIVTAELTPATTHPTRTTTHRETATVIQGLSRPPSVVDSVGHVGHGGFVGLAGRGGRRPSSSCAGWSGRAGRGRAGAGRGSSGRRPPGFTQVGILTQTVPVRPPGGTSTRFAFRYTGTASDLVAGKVTFRANASIIGFTDALPVDNQLTSSSGPAV